VAIFFDSLKPPHQPTSSMHTLAARFSNRSRKPQRVPSVSLAVTQTFVR